MGSKYRRRASLRTQKRAIELYEKGLSFKQIGIELGFSAAAISQWFKKHNIEIKPKSKIVHCSYCGKEKSVFPSIIKIKKMKNHFCDFNCKGKWEKLHGHFVGKSNPRYVPKIETECATCGKRLKIYPSVVSERNYCNQECQHRGLKTGKMVECCICGKNIYRHHNKINSQDRMFCSNACVAVANSGDGNVNWAGGISNDPYCPVWRVVRKEILERDNTKCQDPVCQKKGSKIVVHHIDHDKENCHPDNLITLCNSCNGIASHNREWSEFWFTAIMQRSGKTINNTLTNKGV